MAKSSTLHTTTLYWLCCIGCAFSYCDDNRIHSKKGCVNIQHTFVLLSTHFVSITICVTNIQFTCYKGRLLNTDCVESYTKCVVFD
uniref:Secreted protein n=1 Tax=Anguilla anguilla TaxID=7936 RepID=A0A0E9WX26_ANGAN